jgi:hypothetical protein
MTSQLLVGSEVIGPDGVAAQSELLPPAVAWSLGIIAGSVAASGVEAASIAGRLSSSVLTIGWLNPIYGMVETVLAFVITVITLLVPVITGVLVMLFLPILLIAVWRIMAWRSKQRRAHEEKLKLARERIALAMSQHASRMAAAPSPAGPERPTSA